MKKKTNCRRKPRFSESAVIVLGPAIACSNAPDSCFSYTIGTQELAIARGLQLVVSHTPTTENLLFECLLYNGHFLKSCAEMFSITFTFNR